jgi:hypothetical protein
MTEFIAEAGNQSPETPDALPTVLRNLRGHRDRLKTLTSPNAPFVVLGTANDIVLEGNFTSGRDTKGGCMIGNVGPGRMPDLRFISPD